MLIPIENRIRINHDPIFAMKPDPDFPGKNGSRSKTGTAINLLQAYVFPHGPRFPAQPDCGDYVRKNHNEKK